VSDEKSATLSATGRDFDRALGATAGARGAPAGKFDLRSSLARLVLGQHMLALIDQAIVSGASFLTTVFVGRGAHSSELGIYAIGGSLLVSALMIQDSLIILPYTIHRQERDSAETAQSGSALTQNVLLSIIAAALLAAVAGQAGLFGLSQRFEPMIWALAGIAPFVLTKELCRRFAIAELNVARALALDASVAATQLSVLAWLAWTDRMSASSAFVAIGLASAAPAAVWLAIHRRDFAFSRHSARADLEMNWRLGKWLFVGQLIVQVESYAAYWLSLAIVGAAGTGVFAACASIIAFSNPFISAFRNILTPRFVRAWKKGGTAALRAQAASDAALLGAVTAAFALVVSFLGGDLLRLLYHGEEYQGQTTLLRLLALALLATTMSLPPSTALAAMQRPRLIVVAGAFGAAVTTVLLWVLTVKWGLTGTGLGLVLGGLSGAAARWIAFLHVASKQPCVDDAVADVGRSMAANRPFARSEIERLDEGTQAIVYAVRPTAPLVPAGEGARLIVKLFKSDAAVDVETLRGEARVLSRRRAAMNGALVDGWRIVIPEGLHVCAAPLAIVMTEAPGRSLFNWTKTGEGLTPDLLEQIAEATIASVRKLWARGELHGDFSLQNILCDAPSRTLAFIDFGTIDDCAPCFNGKGPWSPAARDLSHLLSDVASDVRRSIGNARAPRLRRFFAAKALRAFLQPLGSPEEKRRALDEIENCAWAHVENLFDLSLSPRLPWRLYVKFITTRRVAALLAEARAWIDEQPPAPPEMTGRGREAGERHGA
jgi:O-antigen/teichoic acid export membrane protein